MLIGIVGKMGTGKDYILTNIIIPILKDKNEQYRTYIQLSFADQIKVNVMTKNNIEFDQVYVNKTHETRRLLQTEGTENGRDILGENIWINYFDNWKKVHESRGIHIIFCCDVRFKNEYDYIKNNDGIIIKIVAPIRNQTRLQNESKGDLDTMKIISSHISECDLDNLNDLMFDLVIENDPGLDLKQYIPKINNLLKIKSERYPSMFSLN